MRHSSLAEGEFKGKPVLLVCVRCFGQRPTHSRAFLRAGHLGLSVRQPGQSKTLMLFQGCSELLGAASNHYESRPLPQAGDVASNTQLSLHVEYVVAHVVALHEGLGSVEAQAGVEGLHPWAIACAYHQAELGFL